VETRHIPGRARDKGGLTSWEKARRDIARRLKDRAAVTTTLFDFYGLPADFPGREDARREKDPLIAVKKVEAAMAREMASDRFIPFLALHELETWVFAEPKAVAEYFGDAELQATLKAVCDSFPGVEHINHGPETHPSKRLETLIPTYKKRSDGPAILERVGLSGIRAACPHMDEWIRRLEKLA
jgi:hypothetical protein